MVFNSIRRMDVLQDVLEDETITEIMVNGPHHIFVEQAGRLYETGLSFEHQTRLEKHCSADCFPGKPHCE